MSEASIKYRKTPKAPFIAGNILLAALAASLVFFGPNPWSVATVLLVVLCLAIGGLLSLLPFLLDQFALLNLTRVRSSQASINLRSALQRSEEIVEELRERNNEDSPLRIVSERLPELIEEKIGKALEESMKKSDDRPSKILRKLDDLSPLAKDLERFHDDLRVLSSHAATREYVETGFLNVSNELQALQSKLDELRRVQLYGATSSDSPVEQPTPASKSFPDESESFSEPIPQIESIPEPDAEPDLATELDEDWEDPDALPLNELADPESEDGDGDDFTPDEQNADPEKADPQDSELDKDPPNQAPPKVSAKLSESPPSKESPPQPTPEPPPPPSPKPTKIVVSAFVGIQNGIYLRGSGGGLSEDTGLRLDMTGIGEWVWSGELEEGFTAAIYLNDETPSDLGTFTVSPGKTLNLNPSFQQEDHS
tara:strand:- start:4280 stop:5557 length:1278 start_codon:yes stop_codon:yes gene_type:complete